MPATAAAGMLARPLWCPLTLDTALMHAYISVWQSFAPLYLTNRHNRQPTLHAPLQIMADVLKSRVAVNKHLQLCGAKF